MFSAASMGKRKLFYSIFHIFFSTVISWLIISFIYPEQFIFKTISFLRFSDTVYNYHGTFMFISNLLHGGIALWNRYDQQPFMFEYLLGAITSLNNILTGIVYIVLSPFFRYPGQTYNTLFSIFYYVPVIFNVTAGSYLLFQRFTRSRIILFVSTVWAGSVLIPHVFMGFSSGMLFSFFPLLAHFILRFFERKDLSSLLLFILTLTIVISMSAEIGLGYFYLGVHLFIVSVIIWYLISNRNRIILYFRSPHITLRKNSLLKWVINLILTGVLCGLIIGPWLYLLKGNYNDYEMAQSTSRFANPNPLNFKAYFGRVYQDAPLDEFYWRIIAYQFNFWAESWMYMGYTMVFLVIITTILSNDKRKYIFLGTLILFLGINTPKTMNGWTAPFHWLVALTEPFNAVVRSFHVTGVLLLPFAVSAFIPLGLQAIFDASREKNSFKHFVKIILAGIILLIYVFYVSALFTGGVNQYLIIGFFLSSIILIFLGIKNMLYQMRMLIVVGMIAVLFLYDGYNMSIYIRDFSRFIEVIPYSLPDTSEKVSLDYQNPQVFPFKYYLTSQRIPDYEASYQVDPLYVQGYFFRYTDLYKYFTPATNIQPRHKSYAILSSKSFMQDYVKLDNRLIFQADLGIAYKENALPNLISNNLAKNVILVDRNPGMAGIYSAELPVNNIDKAIDDQVPIKQTVMDLNSAQKLVKNDLKLYIFHVPPDFPKYFASDVFSDDRKLMKAFFGDKELLMVQGNLISPFTFDVQNYATGMITVALPQDYPVNNIKLSFIYPTQYSSNIINIWRNESDNLGFDYKTKRQGWLVFHYPYDDKWRLTIDGVKAPIYKANYSFIATPITPGMHKVLLSYWPDTHIRLFMGISIILGVLSTFMVIFFGLKQLSKEEKV